MVVPWWAWTLAAIAAAFGVSAWILRWEFRAQMRAARYGGYVIGGE